jgi:hypothetical protein
VIISAIMPGNREIISSPIWPPSDQPNTIAFLTPSNVSASTIASA